MYSLKVKEARASVAAHGGASTSAQPSPLASTANTPKAADATATEIDTVDQLSFSAGNPRVEHITGIVHLYRHISDDGAGPANTTTADGAATAAPPPLPPERSTQLCALSLPPDMGFSELCTFLGAYFDQVREVRLVRRQGGGAQAACLVLLQFESQVAADGFFMDYHGKPFCMLEPDLLCRLVFVKEVQISDNETKAVTSSATPPPPPTTRPSTSTSNSSSSSPNTATTTTNKTVVEPPPPGTTELPSCPVCLDRLDSAASGIVTTVCNHRFHNQCLRQWGDTSCPVCRHCEAPRDNAPKCSACGTSADLWACLICGHVGCGRYRGSHAADHWQECGHGYALEIESQRVWDYASDAYVHRLVRSKTDGKIVEVPAPGLAGRACGECSAAAAGGVTPGDGLDNAVGTTGRATTDCTNGDGFCPNEMDGDMEEALVASKLDTLAQEYNHLLVSQLESQRAYYEGMMMRQRQELEESQKSAQERADGADKAAAEATSAKEESERRRRQAEDKLSDLQNKMATVRQERDFLKQLNDTLLANQREFVAREKVAAAVVAKKDEELTDLRDQVRDLMVFIQARDIINAAEEEGGSGSEVQGELHGATVLPLPEQQPPSSGGRGHGRRKKK